jgi:aromatic-L-amino-acid/L-tryptophan decarboxylase
MISDDIALARELHRLATGDPELEAWTSSLSITTFRYVPAGVEPGTPEAEAYLNELNREVLERLDHGGEAFLSNAVVGETYLLRACIVNFRTSRADIAALPEIVKRLGGEIHAGRNPDRPCAPHQ